jgi:hypothetical protein
MSKRINKLWKYFKRKLLAILGEDTSDVSSINDVPRKAEFIEPWSKRKLQ